MSGGLNEGTILFDPSVGFGNLPFTTSAAFNRATYIDYFNRLSLLALSMFKWEGLPPKCNERFLEETLFWFGQAIFVERKLTNDIINLRVNPAGSPTIYMDYERYNAYSIGYNQMVNNTECVFVRNNYSRFPTAYTVRLYAQRFYELERTCDVNIKSQKTPILILTDEKNRLTWKNFYAKYDGNEPLIVGDKNLNVDNFKSMPAAGQFLANDLALYKHGLWNEFMTFIGVPTSNLDKKERMVQAEAQSTGFQTGRAAQTMLATRELACKQINELWPDYYPTVELVSENLQFNPEDEIIEDNAHVIYGGTRDDG